MKPKICLTIAGLDPSGGAGVIADIKTFTAFECFPAAAITSLTFQNTQGVFGAENQNAAIVRGQIMPILDDYEIAAVKTGMLPSREVIEEIAAIITEAKLSNIVVDTVVRSTSGFDLIDDDALRSMIAMLFPISDVITPNIPEAERIAKMKIENEEDIRKAGQIMMDSGAKNVLIKGGHSLNPGGGKARDFLFSGGEMQIFEAELIKTTSTHGTGCTLSAAIAANLAKGKGLAEAIESAKQYVTMAIRNAPEIGKGFSPVNHGLSATN